MEWARLAAAIGNIHGGKKGNLPYVPADFMPKLDSGVTDEKVLSALSASGRKAKKPEKKHKK